MIELFLSSQVIRVGESAPEPSISTTAIGTPIFNPEMGLSSQSYFKRYPYLFLHFSFFPIPSYDVPALACSHGTYALISDTTLIHLLIMTRLSIYIYTLKRDHTKWYTVVTLLLHMLLLQEYVCNREGYAIGGNLRPITMKRGEGGVLHRVKETETIMQ
jgi:hypothetical protein